MNIILIADKNAIELNGAAFLVGDSKSKTHGVFLSVLSAVLAQKSTRRLCAA